MTVYNNIEQLVRHYVDFKSNEQWSKCLCPLCFNGKSGSSKPLRAAFLFQGEMCFYHCFNCNVKTNFDPCRAYPYAIGMTEVFKAFGIPTKEIMELVKLKKAELGVSIPQRQTRLLKAVETPDHLYRLDEADESNVIASKAKAFLWNAKHIKHDEYPFYLSTAICHSEDKAEVAYVKSLRNRLIIPFYKGLQMVYYIARSLDEGSHLKYLNLNQPKGNIIYGFDRLYEDMDNILFVGEGFFDMYHVKGVAVLENSLTQDQIDLLEQSPRKKVVIPDRKGDSNKLAEQAVSLGWGLALPKMGDCKDITEGILQYGKLYIIDSIMKNIKEGRAAQTALRFL